MAKRQKKGVRTVRYTEETLHDERKYGFFWYEWIWQLLRPLSILFISLLLVAGVGMKGWDYVYSHYLMPMSVTEAETVPFTVEPGQAVSTVSHALVDQGLLRNSAVLKYMMDFQGLSYRMQPGTYDISPSMSVNEIIDALVANAGKSQERSITIIPGWTVDDIAAYLQRVGALKSETEVEQFKTLSNDAARFMENSYAAEDAAKAPAVKQRKYQLEGYLAPDTYRVYITASPEDILKTLLGQMEKIIDAAFNTDDDETEYIYTEDGEVIEVTPPPKIFDNPISNDHDKIITLASLIEKEAKTGDFAKVSAVFHNRIRLDMRLESCPSVQYALNIKRLALTDADLSTESPYNTYRYEGLPAGPVCNPSVRAIEAALNPDQAFMAEGYMYFCSKDPASGELQFSKTKEEHEAASALYRPLWIEYDRQNENAA